MDGALPSVDLNLAAPQPDIQGNGGDPEPPAVDMVLTRDAPGGVLLVILSPEVAVGATMSPAVMMSPTVAVVLSLRPGGGRW